MGRYFWRGQVVRVIDEMARGQFIADPTVELVLDGNLAVDFDVLPEHLPRAGTSYWLVDDETFKSLVPEAAAL